MRRPLSSILSTLLALVALALVVPAVTACKTTGSKSQGPVVYRVRIQQGDTLAGLAQKYDTTWERIAKLNGIAPGTAPKAGTVIKIEPGPGGYVAGTASRSPVGRTARAAPPAGDVASPDEFTEEDLPDGATAPGAVRSDAPKKKGFLFGGDDEASIGQQGAGGYIWPVRGEISSRFGRRARDFHQGLDIRAPEGTAVWAAADGKVEFAGRKRGYGKVIILAHADQKRTLYAHLSATLVSVNQRVEQGAEIGKVGDTGNATGHHLHFEVRSALDKVHDPLVYLPDTKYLAAADH